MSRSDPAVLRERLQLTVICGGSFDGRDALDIVRAALEGGATAIQLRWKQATTRQLVDLGHQFRTLTRNAGALLIVNDRVDVALAIGADGAHLGDDDLPLNIARAIVPAGFILGRSVDGLADARRAVADGADYVGLGPVYPTATKLDTGPVVGLAGVREVAGSIEIPIVGIGGITTANAGDVVRAGAAGVAVIGAVSAAEDPKAAARHLADAVRGARAGAPG